MKLYYLIISLLFLLFIGCSSTYKATDYSSKDEFYKEFNNSTKNKQLELTFANDSSMIARKGASIKNDSMVLSNYLSNKNISYPVSYVNKASYSNHWKGMIPGSIAGALIGGTASTLRWGTTGANTTLGTLTGAIIGSIVGYIIGNNYTFQFNP